MRSFRKFLMNTAAIPATLVPMAPANSWCGAVDCGWTGPGL